MFQVISPVTGEVLEEFPLLTDVELAREVELAAATYQDWAATPISERAAIARRVADVFQARAEELAPTMTQEMGKLPSEALGELGITADIFRYYADNAETFLADKTLDIVGGKATIRRRPIGVILGIMPWNYPYYQMARFVAPNLILGNTMLLKPAPNCPLTARAIASVLEEAGVPEGVYRSIFVDPSQLEPVIAHPAVQGVSLTGSERAGASVAELAGRHLKKVVLELGGSDPALVLDGADIQATARAIVESRLSNSGQACNAPKRIIVLEDMYEDVVKAAVDYVKSCKVGDPTDPATTVAPLSSRAAAERVHAQVQRAVAQGATLHIGGDLLDDSSAIMTPAVLTDVKPGTDAYKEEIFGPVVVIYSAANVDEAVALANDTTYGLGSSVFSSNPEYAREVGSRIDAGMVYVNQAGGSQADMPFGGAKRSGFGRELGPSAVDEFANLMTIRH